MYCWQLFAELPCLSGRFPSWHSINSPQMYQTCCKDTSHLHTEPEQTEKDKDEGGDFTLKSCRRSPKHHGRGVRSFRLSRRESTEKLKKEFTHLDDLASGLFGGATSNRQQRVTIGSAHQHSNGDTLWKKIYIFLVMFIICAWHHN